ncbi:MAG: hypothetical protein KDB27_24325 [Planctomycetales bacterium]|nr:hypothetical protein [Planctomycetales bacterium]
MPRRFRLWEKKRGGRSTGARWIGSAGEATFFATLSVFGVIALVAHSQSDYLQRSAVEYSPAWDWLIWFVLGALTSIGVIGFVYAIVVAGTSLERRRALANKAADIDLLTDQLPSPKDHPSIPRDVNLTNSPGIRLQYRLPIVNSVGWKLLATIIFCMVWNALVATLLWWEIQAFRSGKTDWYLIALVLPFGTFGIGVIIHLARKLLLATAIGPTSLEISDLPLYPGHDYQVFLTQAGRLSVRSISVTLICEEEVTFSHGTDTRTERRRVYEQRIFEASGFEIVPSAPFEHVGVLNFPKYVMHSFQSDHNAVHWKLVVCGAVDKWSDFERNFPIIVYPVPISVQQRQSTTETESAL